MEIPSLISSFPCQTLVRFCALRRIKPHAPPLVRAPVNSFEFHPCGRTPQAVCLSRWLRHTRFEPRAPSIHRLRRGLPGYLILFATRAFELQRRFVPSKPPSPPVFFLISTHSTAPLGIPLASELSKTISPERNAEVGLRFCTPGLKVRLRSLYAQ